ncbi:sugar ABC transporter permease [bacterium]|nr:sugar ABC transporter permease [bacterium]
MKNFNLLSNENLIGLIFIAPALIGILIFIIIPVFCSFGLSFTDWDLLNEIKFAGLSNYKEIFTDGVFIKILFNTFVFAISTTVFGVIIPLVLAYILQKNVKGGEFFKVAYFLPFITPMIVIGVVWQWIFDPNIGFLNSVLNAHLKWLYDSALALPALIIVSVWKLIGYNVVIFLSGFSSIPTSVIEAAKIDGANGVKLFSKVIVPMLSPTIFFVTVITVISSMQVFDLIYLMTQGGPDNSTNVIVYAIYKNAFEFFDVGKSSALAYVLFVIILALTLLQWHFRKKLVYAEK